MYNSDFITLRTGFGCHTCRLPCADVGRCSQNGASTYASTGSRGEACHPVWALVAFLHLADRRFAGGNGAIEPAPAFTWRENPLRSAHLYQNQRFHQKCVLVL